MSSRTLRRIRRPQSLSSAALASASLALALPAGALEQPAPAELPAPPVREVAPPTRPELPTPSAREVAPAQPTPAAATETQSPPAEAPKDAVGNVFVPLLMYTPETHLGGGAFFVHFFRLDERNAESRTSSVAFVGLATTRKQAIIEVHPDFYFLSDDLHFYGKADYQYFPDSFWGIGNEAPDSDEERYKRERFRLRGGGQYRIVGPIYGGLLLDAMAYTPTYSNPNGVFARRNVPGEFGGNTVGLGPTLSLDTRDNTVAAFKGVLLSATLTAYSEVLGSAYAFRRLQLDTRYFVRLIGEHVLGVHVASEFQGGEVPYYQLAMLGGDELLRGYYLGRYRDQNLAALDLEYRYPIYWRFGGVAFAGAGKIADRIGALASEPLRYTVGGGLRFSLSTDQRLNLRFDAGFGPGTYGLYFTAREAF